MGYCSKCYKELVRDAQSDQREQQQGQRSLSMVGTPTHSLAPIDEQGGAISSDTGKSHKLTSVIHRLLHVILSLGEPDMLQALGRCL
jgi:hypothetical protein